MDPNLKWLQFLFFYHGNLFRMLHRIKLNYKIEKKSRTTLTLGMSQKLYDYTRRQQAIFKNN